MTPEAVMQHIQQLPPWEYFAFLLKAFCFFTINKILIFPLRALVIFEWVIGRPRRYNKPMTLCKFIRRLFAVPFILLAVTFLGSHPEFCTKAVIITSFTTFMLSSLILLGPIKKHRVESLCKKTTGILFICFVTPYLSEVPFNAELVVAATLLLLWAFALQPMGRKLKEVEPCNTNLPADFEK